MTVDREGVEERHTIIAEDLFDAEIEARKLAGTAVVTQVIRIDPTGPGEDTSPTADPFVRRAPNGTYWRLTITNTGFKSVKLTAEEVAALEAQV